jgi:tagatose-1,6-bisphosphate aldolase non-catalytic subunit AgaZ/GatZ
VSSFRSSPDNLAMIEEYARQGADQIVLHLPILPADDALTVPDAMVKTRAAVPVRHRDGVVATQRRRRHLESAAQLLA